MGGERVIKRPLGNWQHTIGVRYRLDRLTQKGNVDISELPDAFKTAASEQEALLFSYETSKTSSNTRLNPTKAFKQTYKLELGSESLLSDANMAIASAGWRFIYSLGKMMITNLLEDLTLVIFLQMTLTKFHTILDSLRVVTKRFVDLTIKVFHQK